MSKFRFIRTLLCQDRTKEYILLAQIYLLKKVRMRIKFYSKLLVLKKHSIYSLEEIRQSFEGKGH